MELHNFAMRMLLGSGHELDAHGDDGHEDDAALDPYLDVHEHDEDTTKWLRIVAIFVILVSGLVGGLPPLFSKVRHKAGRSTCTCSFFIQALRPYEAKNKKSVVAHCENMAVGVSRCLCACATIGAWHVISAHSFDRLSNLQPRFLKTVC
jgi:hypothetical protein